jgi:acyl-coenzyme A thioesterase PaaI-like protein
MEITDIPFARTIGLQRSTSGELTLDYKEGVMNHLQTIAAAAQFSLAELASGECLQELFPELVGTVIPVIRDSRLKFKKPAHSSITALASASEKAISRFRRQLEMKGRALITIDVEVQDTTGTVTSSGWFSWYVQSSS